MAIKLTDDSDTGQGNLTAFIIATLGLLPLFKALFDYAAAGLTRYLIRMGFDQKQAAWRAVLNGLGGIIIFFALGFTLIAFFTFVTPPDGVPIIDLAQLFTNLRSTPGDYIWLMFNLFSMLLPTFLHLSLAALTLALQYPAWWRTLVASLLESGEQSGQAPLLYGVYISAMMILAVSIRYWLIALAIRHDHGAILNSALCIFETFAEFIGGI